MSPGVRETQALDNQPKYNAQAHDQMPATLNGHSSRAHLYLWRSAAPRALCPLPSPPPQSIRRKRTCRPSTRALPMSPTTGRRDTLMAPLSALNPDTLYSANEWIAGVAGGSVGVLGTLIQLELKQVSVHLKQKHQRYSSHLSCRHLCSVGAIG